MQMGFFKCNLLLLEQVEWAMAEAQLAVALVLMELKVRKAWL
jgi:hypothetical protein